jgi:uncharacterized protein (TIGR00251 family)
LDKGAFIVTERDGSVTFEVRVVPRASRTAIVGVHGTALKISLSAPPVDGAANDALIAILAKALGVDRRSVGIVRGGHGRQKLVRIAGATVEQVRALLDAGADAG